MAHYAKVVNGVVDKVIVADAEFFENNVDTSPGSWIQTSYNTRGNVHYGQDGQPDGGVALRGNYAGIGYTYDSFNDVFIPQKPFYSWILNTSTWTWDAPVPMPTDGKVYRWDENAQQWIEVPVGA
ncbi:MAG: hypothetical protein ACOVLB_08145 [Candidatus Nanopelagicus sp.]